MRRSWNLVVPSTLPLLSLTALFAFSTGCGESTADEVDGGVEEICDDAGNCEEVECDEDGGDCEAAKPTKCDPDDDECDEDAGTDDDIIEVNCEEPDNDIDAAACELLENDEVPDGVQIIDTSAPEPGEEDEVIEVDCADPSTEIDIAACSALKQDEVPDGLDIIDTSGTFGDPCEGLEGIEALLCDFTEPPKEEEPAPNPIAELFGVDCKDADEGDLLGGLLCGLGDLGGLFGG